VSDTFERDAAIYAYLFRTVLCGDSSKETALLAKVKHRDIRRLFPEEYSTFP
jgi:hypothetical protein